MLDTELYARVAGASDQLGGYLWTKQMPHEAGATVSRSGRGQERMVLIEEAARVPWFFWVRINECTVIAVGVGVVWGGIRCWLAFLEWVTGLSCGVLRSYLFREIREDWLGGERVGSRYQGLRGRVGG